MIAVELVYNLGVLVAICLLSGLIGQWRREGRGVALLQGALFGAAALVGMLRPVVLSPGLIFDGRSVVISLAGLFFGPLAALVSGGMAAALRLWQGGVGAPMGVSVIICSAACGMFFHYRWTRRGADVSIARLLAFGLLVHVLMLLCAVALLPAGKVLPTLWLIGPPVILAFPLATLFIGLILAKQKLGLRTLDALRESEARFRRSEAWFKMQIDLAVDAIFFGDATGDIVGANQRAVELTGYPLEELIGRNIKDFFSEEERRRTPLRYDLLTQGKVIRTERLLTREDGGTVDIEMNSKMLPDGTFQTFVRDVGDRHRAEAALKESEEVFRLFLRHSPVYVFFKDERLRSIMLSANFERLLGRPVEEMLGKPMDALFPADLAAKIVADDMRALLGGKVVELEEEFNGRFYNTVKFPIEIEGKPRSLAGFTIDITDRKLAEDQLRQAKALLSSIINSMPSALIALDRQGRVVAMNHAAERLAGVQPDKAIGMDVAEAFPALAAAAPESIAALQAKRLLVLERVPQGAADAPRYLDITAYPLGADGESGAAVRVDDVTEKVRMEELIVQTEKMMSLGGLAAGMAHEINNPLGIIMQGAENVHKRVMRDTAANRLAAEECGLELPRLWDYMRSRGVMAFLDDIRAAGGRAAGIVNNMLQFSRGGASQTAPRDLAALINSVVELAANDYNLKKKYDFRHVKITMDIAPDLPPVPCAENEIKQVLLNLLKNAAQAMAGKTPGAWRPEIVIAAKREGAMALIEVADNGPGMEEQVRRRVFEPFFTTKEVGIGTGIGLSISYFIVTGKHNGTMAVRSTPGKGTKFIIRLPLERPSA